MAQLYNRAKMNTSTTGAGTITLGTAEGGFQTFANAGVSNGDTVRYVIEDGVNFEIGSGVYTASGTTLSRTVDESTNSDSAISLSGNAVVSLTAAAVDIGVTTVANVAAMQALTQCKEGELVLAGNDLFVRKTTGFFKIATVTNTGPQTVAIAMTGGGSGTSSAYDLSSAGTATTATGTADPDPEGETISFSAAAGSSTAFSGTLSSGGGAVNITTSGDTSTTIATISQSTNVFTVTPHASNAGTVNVVFSATDGTNSAVDVTTAFTLEFKITNSRYTTFLLGATGNSGVNTSISDSSATGHTLTSSGTVYQGSFSPHRSGGYSTYFDGATDYMKATVTNGLGSGDFTVEGWARLNGHQNYEAFISATRGATGWNIGTNAAGDLLWADSVGGAVAAKISGSAVLSNDVWFHWAFARASGVVKGFLNGTQIGSDYSNTTDFSADTFRIGDLEAGGSEETYGYLRDVRVVVGTAIYTGNFTAPTDPLTAVTNTKLLCCHRPYLTYETAAAKENAFTTISGTPQAIALSPYDYQKYASASFGGSIDLTGTANYMTTASSAEFDIATDSDFTIEAYIYLTKSSGANAPYGNRNMRLITSNNSSAAGLSMFTVGNDIGSNTAGQLVATAQGASPWTPDLAANTVVPVATWTHVVLCRASGVAKIYQSGVEVASASNTENWNFNYSSNGIRIGRSGWSASTETFDGLISDMRFINGTCAYTGAFTPPSGPLTLTGGTYPSNTNVNTSITSAHTKLLLSGVNGKVFDKSQGNNLPLSGNTQSSTAQVKWGSTSSVVFDGTGDYINLDDKDIGNFGANIDFTVETWFRFTSWPGTYHSIMDTRTAGGSATGWTVAVNANGTIYIYSGAFLLTSSASAVALDTWYHVAWVRKFDGSSTRNQSLFLAGTRLATTTTAKTFSDNNFSVAAYPTGTEPCAGYFQDTRVTKNLARYDPTSSSITVPSAELDG